jgi:6-phosphogluconolactonase (cycloisomerase 2 family)
MKLSRIGRISQALVVSMALVLGMSACGGYTVGFLWVPGTQYNEIAGFKIDDFTGNLTRMVGSPYASGGTSPVQMAVRQGGNFVFVVNKGTSVQACDGNVSVFAVGHDGVLTFQQSYQTPGCSPVWALTDSTGGLLYVLDQRAPDFTTTGNGDIAVYQVDAQTGRLQLVPNQLIKNAQGQQLNYFEVGPAPTMMRLAGTCLYTLDSGDQTIYPYGTGNGGQLTVQTNSRIQTGGGNITSINVGGGSIYLTDAAPVPVSSNNPGSPGGSIRIYTSGQNCSLSAQADGIVNNLAGTSNPVYSMTDAKGKFLYVLNQGTTNSNNANSTISAFVIQSTGTLVPISDPQNPYSIGNGPVCMAEDPSSQYVYTSNVNDGTVTGKFINQNTGQLSDLSRGSSFTATGRATCLAISGNVD